MEISATLKLEVLVKITITITESGVKYGDNDKTKRKKKTIIMCLLSCIDFFIGRSHYYYMLLHFFPGNVVLFCAIFSADPRFSYMLAQYHFEEEREKQKPGI